jgi:hypothetical protein
MSFAFMSLVAAVLAERFSLAQSCCDAIDDVRQRFAAKPLGHQSRGCFAQRSHNPYAG